MAYSQQATMFILRQHPWLLILRQYKTQDQVCLNGRVNMMDLIQEISIFLELCNHYGKKFHIKLLPQSYHSVLRVGD